MPNLSLVSREGVFKEMSCDISFSSILNVTGGLHLYPGLKDDFEEWLAANTIEHDYDFPYICSFLIDFYEAFMEHNGINHDYVKRAVEVTPYP